MNPISGAPSLPAAIRSDAAIEPFPAQVSWSGLAQSSGALGVALDATAIARFSRYRDLILSRNAQVNLTAIRTPEDIERRLFLDALAMVPVIDHIVGSGQRYPHGIERKNEAFRLIDIGSGAGFPGLALKIARPQLDITLVDATGKKVAFLDDVIAALELDDARAVHGRAEDLGHDPAYRERFDLATARAVASLPVVLEFVIPFLKIGGTALLPKGLEICEELRAGDRAASRLGAEVASAAQLPVAGTRLVVIRKSAATPAAFPRRAGLPRRNPLGEGT